MKIPKADFHKISPSKEPQKGVKRSLSGLYLKCLTTIKTNLIRSEEKVNEKKKTCCLPIDFNAEESRESSNENGVLDDCW